MPGRNPVTRTGDGIYRARRRAMLARSGTIICYLCGRKVDKTLKRPHPMAPEADHVEAVAAGGSHADGELRIVHASCNRKKGSLSVEQAGIKIKRTSGLWEEMIEDGNDL